MSTTMQFRGSKVIDEQGHRIGQVSDVVFDGAGVSPVWLVIDPGMLRASHYAPVKGAYRSEDDVIVLPYSDHQVKTAPKAKGEHVLSGEDRALLAQHYHLDD